MNLCAADWSQIMEFCRHRTKSWPRGNGLRSHFSANLTKRYSILACVAGDTFSKQLSSCSPLLKTTQCMIGRLCNSLGDPAHGPASLAAALVFVGGGFS